MFSPNSRTNCFHKLLFLFQDFLFKFAKIIIVLCWTHSLCRLCEYYINLTENEQISQIILLLFLTFSNTVELLAAWHTFVTPMKDFCFELADCSNRLNKSGSQSQNNAVLISWPNSNTKVEQNSDVYIWKLHHNLFEIWRWVQFVYFSRAVIENSRYDHLIQLDCGERIRKRTEAANMQR